MEPPLFLVYLVGLLWYLDVFVCISFLQRSFAEGKLPAHVKVASDIDSCTIAERFESISGMRIYGVSAWREWCSLERTEGPNTLQWLSKVPNNSHSTPHNMKIQPSVSEQTVVVFGSVLFQR